MSRVLTDISGNPIPTQSTQSADVARVLAVPPIRNTPSETAVEFFFSLGNILPAATASTALTTAFTALPVPFVADGYRGRIDYFVAWCPDLILANAPQVFWRLFFNRVLVNAWARVPFHPRTGLANLNFPAVVDIPPNTSITMTGENADPANAHTIGIYVHGWIWPQDQSDQSGA